ncbi:DUF2764 family protein [Prolixibacteraceae bacterium Z1-6]|uniref:DUF2764 family protein n=1 Tax=Draconibacterium aestuarii TaxID=2998507 RepID=A0A9X3FA49_9BACT|nr:DUF2764 family protein [Prolixibacteraceae bacterium Z1-6]
MSNLVYLMCSLPSLSFGQSPPISMEEFTSDAKSQLNRKSFAKLEAIDIQNMSLNSTKAELKKFSAMFTGLKEDISEIRHAKTQRRSPRISALPKTILAKNPFEREMDILKWQWEELDSIEAGKTFTLTEVLVYKLKLQILTRLDSFNTEKGSKILASVVNPAKKKEEQWQE